MKRPWFIVVLPILSGLISLAIAHQPPEDHRAFATATAPYSFSFPRDHAAHPDYQDEWWQFIGHLQAADGRQFDYFLTFFRFAIVPRGTMSAARGRWRDAQIYSATLAITDEQGQQFYYNSRFERGALDLADASSGRFSIHVDDWSIQGEALPRRLLERITLHATDGFNGLKLVESPQKPPAINGVLGVFRKGTCTSCSSHYYSYTRLKTNGTLTYGGRSLSVRGLSWMDHEFGSRELQSDSVGWDKFSMQLDDGRDLMLFLVRRKDGSTADESSGILVSPDGRTTYLPRSAFSLSVRGGVYYRSQDSHTNYPSLWQVFIPSARLDVSLSPLVRTQEIVAKPHEHGISFWAGPIEVQDRASGGTRLGGGYAELTGYASPVAL